MATPDMFIPAAIDHKQIEAMTYQWLAEGEYTPTDIFDKATFEKKLYLVPMYIYNKAYNGYCTANIGYNKHNSYEVYNPQTNKNEHRSQSFTDWHPYSQPVMGKHTSIAIAADFLPDSLLDEIEKMVNDELPNPGSFIPFDYKHLYVCSPENIGDFKYSGNDLWLLKAKDQAEEKIKKNVIKNLPGERVDKLNFKVDFNESTEDDYKSFYMPFWVVKYRYKTITDHLFADARGLYPIRGERPVDNDLKMSDLFTKWSKRFFYVLLTVIGVYLLSQQESKYLTTENLLFGFLYWLFMILLVRYQYNTDNKKYKQEASAKRQAALSTKIKHLEIY